MRTSWWPYIVAGGLVAGSLACSAAYLLFNHSPPPMSEQAERHPLDQKPEQPLADPEQSLAYNDERPLQHVDPPPASLGPDQSPDVQKPDQLPDVQKEARLEDAVRPRAEDAIGPGAVEPELNDAKKKTLSYLHYYAYSQLPPEIKPADTVLASLKDIPSGTPIDEIKRVADVLEMDFAFMKTIAKIESGFDPKQRTGSYIGLFQLSKYEFAKYGSGDILVPRDNTVAAALKMMTEAVLFEKFTYRKPTLNDLYLIHQQGVEGAAQHLSHPNRLAWKAMCATDEGKQKGEKWCKRAIWGNTLPAIKRVWKDVNKVTSGAFVAMWQQRVSQFYARYYEAAAPIGGHQDGGVRSADIR